MPNPVLNPPNSLSAGVVQTGQSVSAVDTAVAQLLALAIPDGSLVPSLPVDVQQTRSDTQLWTSQYRSVAISALDGVVNFSGTFDNFYAQLVPLADALASGDKTAKSQFNQLLKQLRAATQTQAQAAEWVAQQLTSYDLTLQADLATLHGDNDALLKIAQTQHQIALAAKQTADMLNQEIEQLRGKVLLAYIQGRYALAELDQLINILTGNVYKLQEQQYQANATASHAQQQATAASSEAASVQQYQSNLNGLQSAINQLVNGWAVMDADFGVLEQAEKIHSYGAWTPSLLKAAMLDWNVLAAQAQAILDELQGVSV